MAKKWIQKMHMVKGGLHKSLGVKQGKKITSKQLAKGAKSKSPLTRKRVALAKTLKSFHR